jgi:hypothetical protein
VTPRREFFYWATVCCTFALGTATGDLTATTLHLGYFTSGVVFTLAILAPLTAWRLGVNPVLTFWVAYILTRPIGASFADFFGMPKTSGGLGIGHGPVSLVTIVLVVASIAYLASTGKDQPSPVRPAMPAGAGSGYGPQRQPGYGPPGYGPGQPGYGPQAAYQAQPAYPPQPGYPPQPAYPPPPQPGYGPTFTPAAGYQPGPGQPRPRQRPAPDRRQDDGDYGDYGSDAGYRGGGGYRGGD